MLCKVSRDSGRVSGITMIWLSTPLWQCKMPRTSTKLASFLLPRCWNQDLLLAGRARSAALQETKCKILILMSPVQIEFLVLVMIVVHGGGGGSPKQRPLATGSKEPSSRCQRWKQAFLLRLVKHRKSTGMLSTLLSLFIDPSILCKQHCCKTHSEQSVAYLCMQFTICNTWVKVDKLAHLYNSGAKTSLSRVLSFKRESRRFQDNVSGSFPASLSCAAAAAAAAGSSFSAFAFFCSAAIACLASIRGRCFTRQRRRSGTNLQNRSVSVACWYEQPSDMLSTCWSCVNLSQQVLLKVWRCKARAKARAKVLGDKFRGWRQNEGYICGVLIGQSKCLSFKYDCYALAWLLLSRDNISCTGFKKWGSFKVPSFGIVLWESQIWECHQWSKCRLRILKQEEPACLWLSWSACEILDLFSELAGSSSSNANKIAHAKRGGSESASKTSGRLRAAANSGRSPA